MKLDKQEETPSQKQFEKISSGMIWSLENVNGAVEIGGIRSNRENVPIQFLRCFHNPDENKFMVWSDAAKTSVEIQPNQWTYIGRETSPHLFPDDGNSRHISRDHLAIYVTPTQNGRYSIQIQDRGSKGGTFSRLVSYDKPEDLGPLPEGPYINEFTYAGNQEGGFNFWQGRMQGVTERAAEGKYRDNQDGLYINPEMGAIAVADGMGGHGGGAEASAHTLRSLHDDIQRGSSLDQAIYNASVNLMQAMPNKNAGAALAAAKIHNDGGRKLVEVAHVGDCRILIVSHRNGALRYRSADQSVVGEMLARGIINEKQALEHPKKNVVRNAIQGDTPVKPPEHYFSGYERDDYAVVLTDGIADVISDEEIAMYCYNEGPSAVHTIAQLAKERQNQDSFETILGGQRTTINAQNSDNISIGVMQMP